jgi:3-oxoacyl-[acyl-carrier-protein] synthase II
MEKVVVTGYGVVWCLGNNPDKLFNNLVDGVSGISQIKRFDIEKFSVNFAGEIKEFDHTPYFTDRDAKRTSRNIQYMVHATEQALAKSGLDKNAVPPHRAGVIVGSGMGGMEIFQKSSADLFMKGPRRVSPFFVPMAISNMGAGEVSIRLGWMGPNWSIVSACATGNHSIISAADQIRLGKADVMVAGGSEEAVCEIGVAGFNSMKALSTRVDDPQAASRPFDKDRDGFVIGEGAGAIILESESHAKKRGATILAYLDGYGTSGDAYHMSAPREDGAGVVAAIQSACEDAKINATDIDYINCHGTSTPLGDVAECGAIAKALGGKIDKVVINSSKSMIGHPLGAASAIEAVIAVKSLEEQKVHKTLNLDNQDEKILLNCAKESMDLPMTYAMSNSFGFGGHNSAVIFKKA